MPLRGRMIIQQAEVVIGFRPQGQLSLYWDQDPVFQFDEAMRLRRVFVDSNRLKAQQGRLVRLQKRNPHNNLAVGRLRLESEPLTKNDQQQILQTLADCLQQISQALENLQQARETYRLQVVGASEQDFADRVRQWVARQKGATRVAEDPSA